MGTSHAQYVNPSLVLLAGQGAAAPSQLRVCQLRAGGKVKRQSLKKVQTRFVACSSKQIILVSEPCGQVLVLLVGSFSARFVCIACILLRILIIPRAKEALTTGFRASSVLRVKEGMCIPRAGPRTLANTTRAASSCLVSSFEYSCDTLCIGVLFLKQNLQVPETTGREKF